VKATKIILSVAGLAMLVMVSAMACLVIFLDRHKGLLEINASAALGREVRIDDGVQMHWSMRPSIALIGLRVGNPPWASGEYLAQAERVVVQFDIPSLLHGRLEVDEVTLQNADIDLETGADDRGNWHFDGGVGPGVRIDALKVEGSRLGYRSAHGSQHRLEVNDFEYRRLGDEALTLEARLVYRNVPLSVSGTSGRDPESGTGARSFKVKLTAENFTSTISGHATAPFELTGMAVELHSKRLDLPQALSALWPTLAFKGSLDQVDMRLNTAGGTPQALIGNLSGKLRIGSAHLMPPPGPEAKAEHIEFTSARITAAPKQPVRLKTGVAYAGQHLELDLTGGTLADLFVGDQHWHTIKVAAKGRFDKQPIEIAGQIGPLSALLAGRDLGVDLTLHHHGIQGRLAGKLAGLDGLRGSKLAIEIAGPSFSRLTPWLGVEMPHSKPFKVSGQLESGEHSLRVNDLKGTDGASDVSGEIIIRQVPHLRIEAKLSSSLLDLTPYVSTGDKTLETTKQSLSNELPLESLHGLDGKMRWRAGHLRIGDFGVDDFRLDGALDAGHLHVDMTAGEERLAANIDLKPSETDWRLTLKHKGKLNLGLLLVGEEDSDPRSHASLAVDVHLTGVGRSPAALLGSVDGRVEVVVGEGRVSRKFTDLPLGTLLYTLLSTLEPGSDGQSYRSLECAVLHFDVAKGIATSTRGLALRTGAFNAVGAGTLRMQTGELDLRFKTAQRKGLGISALAIVDKFMHLTGTLQQPRVKLDSARLLAYGGAAWATAGLSVLFDTLVNRLTAFSNPCETVLKSDVK